MKVLMLNASHNDLRLIQALRSLGCHITTSGNRPELPAHALADYYINADYSDKEKMLKIAEDGQFDAICPCCNDFGVITSAYIAEKLGLPGHDTYAATLTLHHKDRFRAYGASIGLSMPSARAFSGQKTAEEYASSGKCEFPLVVKPVDRSAGNGIRKVTDREELLEAVRIAFEASPGGRIVIETYIDGNQYGFCTFLAGEKVRAVCTNNEYSVCNPYRVEADTFPAAIDQEVKEALIRDVEKVAADLHLKDGIFHLQFRLADGKYYILECMRRVLGNMYGMPAENHCAGLNWDYWEARAKCGLDCNGMPANAESGFWAYRALISPRAGTYQGYDMPGDIRAHLHSYCEIHKPGYAIINPLSDPLGILFFSFDSQEQMQEMICGRYSEISIKLA